MIELAGRLAITPAVDRFFTALVAWWNSNSSAAGGLAVLSLAVVLGLALGAVRWRGIRLGISGVLFAALLFGQLGFGADVRVLQFLRDFALILFVYAVGLQVGPGFLESLRADGLRLNLLSILVLIAGAGMAVAIGRWLPASSSAGLYTGAFTTTPGLAAAQEALRQKHAGDITAPARTALAY